MLLVDALLPFEKLADVSPKTEGDLCAEMVAAIELLDAKRASVEGFKRELATEIERWQQLLADC